MKNIKKYLSAASAAFILCSAVTCHGLSAADLASVSQGEVARYIVIGGVFIALIGVLLLLLSFLKPKKKDYADDFYDDDYDDFNDRKKPSKHSEVIDAEIAQDDDEPVDADNADTESESADSDNSDNFDDSNDSDTTDGDEVSEDINADNDDDEIGNEDVLDDESKPDNAETEGTEQESEEPGEPDEKVRLTLGGMNSDDVRIVEFSDKATLGRRSTNSVVISDNAVSGEHCRLTYSDGKVIVEDMGSTNGTILNGEKITVSEIKNGDVLILGKTKYKISFSIINE
jgi:hypothetical protein